jgi:predicted ATP-dependent protease
VDGDSASAAELCALLSALGRIPLKQSMAVTGSINQLGEIQAIGGVNEKIEGFFDICLARGLTGDQAVIIPASNQVHLMLREDIRQVVEQGMFQIYTAAHVEDVMELLSGLPAGKRSGAGNYPRNSFNYKIQQRIRELRKQEQQSKKGNRTASKKSSKSKKQ